MYICLVICYLKRNQGTCMFGLVSEQEIKVHVYVFDILTGNQST